MNIPSISEFNYSLPSKQIASHPLNKRDSSKLMYLNITSSILYDKKFLDVSNFLKKGDLIILNDTRVIPGRLFARKETGGVVEILFHKYISKNSFRAIFSSSKPLKLNSKIFYEEEGFFIIVAINDNYVDLAVPSNKEIINILKEFGVIPLPKYIKRPTSAEDKERYQTIYASKDGSIAAPTAGLHFTKNIINKLINMGIQIHFLTLHVTYNTFKPIIIDDYSRHKIGKEFFMVKKSLFDKIKKTKSKGNKVISVGTTVARTLEYCYLQNINKDFEGYVDLYITPGFKFNVIDSLLTNFHLPKSSLLLLVCAFAGKKKILNAYEHAVKNNYRFYSYGDCMLIDK